MAFRDVQSGGRRDARQRAGVGSRFGMEDHDLDVSHGRIGRLPGSSVMPG
jgi:hypothetical protein